MRKNQSKFKNQQYIQSLIDNALSYKEISYLYIIDNITEKTFSDLKDKKVLPIDIYLPKYNAVIECQGAQHFRFVKSFCKDLTSFEYIKKHDKMKYDYFKNSHIKLYYYTSKYNEDLIPTKYFDKVYTNIEELISIITS